MSTPLFAPPPPPQAVINAAAPPATTTTPAFPQPPASSGSPPPPSATSPSSRSTISTGLVVGIASGGVVVVLVVMSLLFIFCKKKRRPPCSASPSISLSPVERHFTLDEVQEFALDEVQEFTLDEVREFTGGFPEANLLGKGWYGRVYPGVLPNGEDVAVKRMNLQRQGEWAFLKEVEIMSQVHHKHVVSLVGYCKTVYEHIIVCELVPNKTLEFHLHGEGRPTLDWPARVKIALGCAKGLAYLHEDCHPKIIHCDIMGPNILVDNEFEPKIADFGLAKCTSDANSHVSTNVKGTFGYLGPAYFSRGNLTEKHDIFCCGVVFLELITGSTRDSMDGDLVKWARPLLTKALEDRNYGLFVDPKLQNNYDNNEMARMVACAAACVRRSADHRPRMSKIVRALEGDLTLSELNDGITPGQSFVHRFHGSWDCGTSQDLENSKRMPLASPEYGSSHYREPTSDDDLYPSGSSSEGPSRQTTRDLEMGRMERDGRGFSGGS